MHSCYRQEQRKSKTGINGYGGCQAFDVDKLCSKPLLQSVNAEVLRLRVAALVVLDTGPEPLQLKEWTFR